MMNDDILMVVSLDGELAQLEILQGLGSFLSPEVDHTTVLLFLGRKRTCGH